MNTLKTLTFTLILFFTACTSKEPVQVLPSTTETVLVVETGSSETGSSSSESTSSETGDGDGDAVSQEVEVAPVKTDVK